MVNNQEIIRCIESYASASGPGLSSVRILELKIHDPDLQELLRYASIIKTIAGLEIDLTGSEISTPWPQLGERVLADSGSGDLWTVDVEALTGLWSSVFHICHDPPVTFRQFDSYKEFLVEALTNREFFDVTTAIVDRLEARLDEGVSVKKAMSSEDSELRNFASSLGPNARIHDLRGAAQTCGFDHATNDPIIKRYGSQQIFAREFREESRSLYSFGRLGLQDW